MSFLLPVIRVLNVKGVRRYLGWLVAPLVYLHSLIMWARRVEFASFQDCLFYSWKQARHPRVGERAIEYPWVYKRVSGLRDCRILDVGAREGSPVADLLVGRNDVYAIDPNASHPYNHGRLTVLKGDIRATSFDPGFFDAVIAVSTLEHIGVPGRYGVTKLDEGGDLAAMREIGRVLRPGGVVLITVPYGTGRSLPLNRLYDAKRFRELLTGYDLVEEEYFRYLPQYGLWVSVAEAVAADTNWDIDPWYALACFKATKAQYSHG
jgi:SAM-dependent methyltransferase